MVDQVTGVIHFGNAEESADRAFQVDDGTRFYHSRSDPKSIYVKYQGERIFAKLPEGEIKSQMITHENALFFMRGEKIYKAVFMPSTGICITMFRQILKPRVMPVEKDGLCYQLDPLMQRAKVQRICDEQHDTIPYRRLNKLGAMIIAVHRKKAIFVSGEEHLGARSVTDSIILVTGIPKQYSFYSSDSSPFFYFSSGQNLFVLDTSSLKFLPTLCDKKFVDFGQIIGVLNGVISVQRATDEISGPVQWIMSAQLPSGYFEGTSIDMTPQPIMMNQSVENRAKVEIREYSSKFASEFSVTSIRGEGGYGCVFETCNKTDNWNYAVKRVAVHANHLERALREVRAMAQLDHPGIIRYNSSWTEQPPEGWQHHNDIELLKKLNLPRNHLKCTMNYADDSVFIYIQMQLCNYSLSQWLKENQKARNIPRMKRWFKQIVSAVEYIHANNLIHRDLKPSNILFSQPDLLKLCDLGIVTERRNEEESNSDLTRTSLGTMLYMSPEQRLGNQYSSKTDVFTLGLILTELCVVMTERSKIFDNYRRGVQCDLIEDAATANFIRMLTQVDPNIRPTSKEMLDHFFLS